MDGRAYLVTRNSQVSLAFAILIGIFGLASCSAQDGAADDFRNDDALGVWTSVDSPETIALELDTDGTFVARGWPINLFCERTRTDPLILAELSWNSTANYSGSWELVASDDSNVMRFVSLGPECRANWPVVVWEIVDEGFEFRVYLDPNVSTEAARDDQILRFRRD